MSNSNRFKTEPSDREIHLFFDKELGAEEMQHLGALIDENPTLRAKLEGLAELRVLIRLGCEVPEDLPSEAMWQRVKALTDGIREVQSIPEVQGHGLGLFPSEEGREGGSIMGCDDVGLTPAQQKEAVLAPLDRLRLQREQRLRKQRLAISALGIAACAAALALALLPDRKEGVPLSGEGASLVVSGNTNPTTHHRTEVVAVDFGSSPGVVFSLEGENGEEYAVVWLSDDGFGDEKNRGGEVP
ncbi:MAG: hypothetical protein NZM37_00660 [Sandaracinaceae bacterium]|nr:hypothetical protein [Sandaracinaceae bacterium]MDW8246362.1 hypothetical protein [Sandaracinaceae bacterium]